MASFISFALDIELGPSSSVYQLHLDGECPSRSPSPTVQQMPTISEMTTTKPADKPLRRRTSWSRSGELSAQHRVYPHTNSEWKCVLAEVKADYIGKRFQQCSSRCSEVLRAVSGSNTNSSSVEKAHLVFLRFYAASALESQVRSLHHSSPYRLKLLRQAREHYHAATDLLAQESEQMSQAWPPHAASSSPTRPGSSSSRADSTSSTPMSSPTPSSLCAWGDEDEDVRRCSAVPLPKPLKPKKHVAFVDLATDLESAVEVPEVAAEPAIRPDSPTLGFDEWLGRSSPDLIIASPESPTQRSTSPIPAPQITPGPLSEHSSEKAPPEDDSDQEQQEQKQPEDRTFQRAESLQRYRSILTSLQQQIFSHAATLEREISDAENPVPPPPSNKEMRSLELRARIERLKASGWPRRKFDARRYEALRERVAEDMLAY